MILGVTTGASVQTSIQGDLAFAGMSAADTVENDANDDFIWSPNATTTSSATHADWTNGYQVIGLSASAMDTAVLEN